MAAGAIIGFGALIHAPETAAQAQVLPKPGTVLQFTLTRTQDAKTMPTERSTITIRALEGDRVVADVLTRPANLRYVTRTYLGLFTYEIADIRTVYRHEFDASTLRKLWPLTSGRSLTITGRMLAIPTRDFAPGGAAHAIGSYSARFTVGERQTAITAAGPFEFFVTARVIERRDLQGAAQRETGEIWYAPRLGWQLRSETRTEGTKPLTSRTELTVLEER